MKKYLIFMGFTPARPTNGSVPRPRWGSAHRLPTPPPTTFTSGPDCQYSFLRQLSSLCLHCRLIHCYYSEWSILSSFFRSSFFLQFLAKICVRFSSLETSVIHIKLQHNEQNGLHLWSITFWWSHLLYLSLWVIKDFSQRPTTHYSGTGFLLTPTYL